MSDISSKKVCAAVMAFATAVTALTAMPSSSASADETAKYEFEDGTITGTSTEVMTEETGYSGTGYVYLKNGGDTLTVEVDAPSTGMYDISVCYNLPTESGSKTQFIYINDVNQGQIVFSPNDKFSETSIGTFKLTKGKNTIKIESSWGWTMFDYLTIKEAVLPELSASSQLSDPQATDSAKRLMSYLADTYGTAIISGQQEFYGVSRDDEFNYIKELSGELPAIRGFDFGETCPLYAWDAGTADRAIEWSQNGGIATASWHINVPTTMSEYTLGSTMDFQKTTYSEKTDFVTANVMVEGTVEHDYFLLAVDNLAAQLKKLQDADVPLIFRPFHEAEGNGGADGSGAWFWWAKEGAETYKELYKYLYNILTEEYGLHNLIWEFNSYVYDSSYEWYPGTDYVDIIGYDKYNATNWTTGTTAPNTSAISGIFYSLVDMYGSDKKPIAMAENDTIPSVENLVEEKAGWLYFCPWYGEHLMDTNYNTKESLAEIYKSEYVITLDELPDLKTYPIGGTGNDKPEETTPAETTPAETTTEKSEDTTPAAPTGITVVMATVAEKTDKTITIKIEDASSGFEIGSTLTIDIDETYKDVASTLEENDLIRITYHDINTNPVSIELIEKAETTVTTTEAVTTTVADTTTTADTTSDDNPVTVPDDVNATLLGDVNGDNEIDVRDVTMLKQNIVKLVELDTQQSANADVIKDNTIDVKDLGQLIKYIIKVIDKF
jgi:mannan endo-1,4-beta-mannosidase